MSGARAGVIGALVLALSARNAGAVDLLTLLDWTCAKGNRANTTAAIKREVLGACGASEVPQGNRYQICAIFKGAPYACYDHAVNSENTDCQYGKEELTVSAETTQTLGWRVEGSLTIGAEYVVNFTGGNCDLDDKEPTADGEAGEYVSRRGQVRLHAIFKAAGTGKVTFLGGTIMSVDAGATCNDQLVLKAYERDSVVACKKRCAPQPVEAELVSSFEDTAPGARYVDCVEDDGEPPPPSTGGDVDPTSPMPEPSPWPGDAPEEGDDAEVEPPGDVIIRAPEPLIDLF